jgi:hypothetical protein
MVAAEAGASTVVEVASAEADISAAELRARAMVEEARVLLPPEDIVAERPRVPMGLTGRVDLAEPTGRDGLVLMAAGHTVALRTARGTLVRTAAGQRRRQRVHVMVQLPMAAQTQRQPREITARLALTPIAERPGTLQQQPTAEALQRQGRVPPAG